MATRLASAAIALLLSALTFWLDPAQAVPELNFFVSRDGLHVSLAGVRVIDGSYIELHAPAYARGYYHSFKAEGWQPKQTADGFVVEDSEPESGLTYRYEVRPISSGLRVRLEFRMTKNIETGMEYCLAMLPLAVSRGALCEAELGGGQRTLVAAWWPRGTSGWDKLVEGARSLTLYTRAGVICFRQVNGADLALSDMRGNRWYSKQAWAWVMPAVDTTAGQPHVSEVEITFAPPRPPPLSTLYSLPAPPQEGPSLVLVPWPRRVSLRSGFCEVGPGWWLGCDSAALRENLAAVAEVAQAMRSLAGERFRLHHLERYVPPRHIFLGCDGPFSRDIGMPSHVRLRPEGYWISVQPDRILVIGKGSRGLFYGVQTLLQLLSNRPVPCAEVEDWPVLRFRGVHIYTFAPAAHLASVRRFIDALAHFKINAVVLQVSAGMKIRDRPEAYNDILSVSPERARALVRFAKSRHMEVIPEVEALGHANQWVATEPGDLEKFPHLREIFEKPDTRRTLCPSSPETRKLLADVFDAVMEAYERPALFHVGLDELRADELGSSPACGGRSAEQLFREHVAFLHDFLARRGAKMMMWGDMLLRQQDFPPGYDALLGGAPANTANAINALPRDIVICDWHYADNTEYPSLEYFQRRGFKVLACPWHSPVNIYNFILAAAARKTGALGTTWSGIPTSRWFQTHADSLSACILQAEWMWSPGVPSISRTPHDVKAELARALSLSGITAMMAGRFIPVTLDLRLNRSLADDRAGDWEGGWIDSGRDADLRALPTGQVILGGVPFLLSRRNGNGCILLGGSYQFSAAPLPLSSGKIAVGHKARALHFLHATGFGAGQGKRVAHYLITYADGQQAQADIVEGKDIYPWDDPLAGFHPDTTAAPAWMNRVGQGVACLWRWQWRNPRPAVEIRDVEMVSEGTGAHPALFAISAQVE